MGFKPVLPQNKSTMNVPAGVHVARLIEIIDIGTQRTEWMGKVRLNQKFRATWEVPAERTPDDRPLVISKTYTWSWNEESAMRKDLTAWRGKAFTNDDIKGFQIQTLLGRPCQLVVEHNEKNDRVFANIDRVTPLLKGVTCPEQENTSKFFDLDQPDMTVFNGLPDWLQEIIQKSPEWAAMNSPTKSALADEEIPF
jgi:hypothetical protein